MESGLRYVQPAQAAPFEVVNFDAKCEAQSPGQSYFSVQYEYFNGLTTTVRVVDRDGMIAEIPSSSLVGCRNLVIRVSIIVSRGVNLNIDSLLNASSPTAKAFAQVIEQGDRRHKGGQQIFSLDYHITYDDINSQGGSLYLTNLDRVVSILNTQYIPFHPYSEVGIRNQMVADERDINDVGSFGYSLRIIDSFDHFGDRYVNINNQVYKVPVVKKSSMPDGVYLVSSGPVTGNFDYPKPVSHRFSFEEADEALGLYRTVDQARTFGDTVGQKKRELEERSIELKEREQRLKEEEQQREHEFKLHKQALEEEKAESEAQRKREENEMSQRMARMKDELSQLEHRRNVTMLNERSIHDQRSLERKESSEIIKFLPTLISSTLTLFILVSKLRGNN